MAARSTLRQSWRSEFQNYSRADFGRDALAGLTVGAVALPLALAFGVASGASPAAGLVTAILAGLIIGALSGAAMQISGPTGAMSAVLILLVQQYGLVGVWVAGVLSGVALLLIGLLRLGRFIAFIPAPVITGFTSGIALIIAIGQLDAFLGVTTPKTETSAQKLLGYFGGGFVLNGQAIALGLVVVLTMLAWPKAWGLRFPASLLGLVIATTINALLGWPVKVIGEIPQTLLLDQRLTLDAIPWGSLRDFIAPTLTITALGAVESLLCGAVTSNMSGTRLHANQELIGQGVGNIIIPFFGGVPATAAIARSSVGIKAGGKTRMVSFVHAAMLLISMFLLAPVMERIPLAALAGVLIVTAWRMNEWEAIRYLFGHRLKRPIAIFFVTMLATVTLDLTQAILIGTVISAAVFLSQAANIEIDVQQVDRAKMRQRGFELPETSDHIRVAYITGPLFFAATSTFNEAFAALKPGDVLILSVRGMPLIDTSGMQALAQLHERVQRAGGTLMLAGLHAGVRQMLERGDLLNIIGRENIFWSADQAILAAVQRKASAHAGRVLAQIGIV